MSKDKKKESSSKDNYLLEEVTQLNDKVKSLKEQNLRLMQIIKDNELEDELSDIQAYTPEQSICINGLIQLSEMFENGSWGKDEIQAYDVLHKNYRMIKGEIDDTKKKKTKKADVGELMSIVKGIKP